MAFRVLYLAGDARSQLMRAQLLTHALREAGAEVDVMTASVEGQQFLADFGIEALIAPYRSTVEADGHTEMQRDVMERRVARYALRPGRMLRDMFRLKRHARGANLVLNDSFHPAPVWLGALPAWRSRVAHVWDTSHDAPEAARPRLPARGRGAIAATLADRAVARLEHDTRYASVETVGKGTWRLPSPVAVARPENNTRAEAAVYLNTQVHDPRLALALQAGIMSAGLGAHCVSEGYRDLPGWAESDQNWVERAALAALIVSTPGMAALSTAKAYRRPILLIQADQPEQAANVRLAARMGLEHDVVVWRGDSDAFQQEVSARATVLVAEARGTEADQAYREAQARLAGWVRVILELGIA